MPPYCFVKLPALNIKDGIMHVNKQILAINKTATKN